MNRRKFLSCIGTTIGGIALAPIIRGGTAPYVVAHKAEMITPQASGCVVHVKAHHRVIAGNAFDVRQHSRTQGEFINVKSYGAIGNCASDDTKAFQAALDSAATYKRGRIIVPAGAYKVRPLILKA